jgi:hypothetical protein
MATATHDVKTSGVLADDKQFEDVALKAPSSEGETEANRIELEEKESRRVLSKVDYRLVPILSLLYLVAFIDRSNSRLSSLQRSWMNDC